MVFLADGTCEWSSQVSYSDAEIDEWTGWLWSVSGADEAPDWGAPWIVQVRPGPEATTPEKFDGQADGKTVRIIAIDAQAFTHSYWMETHDIISQMSRAP